MRVVFLAIIVLLFVPSQICAQTWREYSSKDKSFRVKLPVPLREVASFEGEHGANLSSDQNTEGVMSYAAIETSPEASRFGVVVINGTTKSIRALNRKEDYDYLSALIIGDDDESQFMKAPVTVRSNGLIGKEYSYIRESRFGSELFTRGRIFETGSNIYIIVFVGKSVKNLNSPDAARFLNSFRILKRSKNR